MSTSYQTTAKPRGRREGDSHTTAERPDSSRASSHASQRLTKTASRPLEETKSSRPSSPALFWQRNRVVDPSTPRDSVLVSPKASFTSAPSKAGNEDSRGPVSPTKSVTSLRSKRSAETARSRESHTATSTTRSNPVAAIDEPSDSAGRSTESSAAQKVESEKDASSKASLADLQPSVADEGVEEYNASSRVASKKPSIEYVMERSRGGSLSDRAPAQNDMSVVTNQHNQPDSAQPEPDPIVSPPQSPSMYHQSSFGSPSLGSYTYAYSQPGNFDPNYPAGFYPAAYQQQPFMSPQSPRQGPMSDRSMSSQEKEEPQRILEKVANVLPDINRLLEHYQLTQGELSAKDLLVKQAELRSAQEVANLRLEIEIKKEEYDKVIEKVVGETHKYKAELQEKDALIATLQHSASDREGLQKELDKLKTTSGESALAAVSAQKQIEQLTEERDTLRTEMTELQETHVGDLETRQRDHDAALSSVSEASTRAAEQHKGALSKVQMELATLLTKHSQQKKEIETNKAGLTEMTERLAMQEQAHAEAVKTHQQELESQLQTLVGQREEELSSLQIRHTEETKRLVADHDALLVEKSTDHNREIYQLNSDLDDHKKAFATLQTSHEVTKGRHEEIVGAVTAWKLRRAEWEAENEKLSTLIGNLSGTNTSDESYSESFQRLSKMIDAVATEYFTTPPRCSPVEQSLFLEGGLPDCFGSTKAAHRLRSQLITHKIYRILDARIFQPFLFVPYEDHPDADLDSILSGLSTLIAQKSRRREALWRCIVLRSNYTSSEGKSTAATVASVVHRRIMEALQPVADPDALAPLTAALKGIVKAAVEIWRRVRVNTDWIHATLPDTSDAGKSSDEILWVRPQIVREQIGSLGAQSGEGKTSSVLLEGLCLRRDSSLIQDREQELAQRLEL